MTRHLPFYLVEVTFITFLAWLGLFLAVRALRRRGVALWPRWTATIAIMWTALACVDVLMREVIGPEFTLHYYFGIWTLLSGGALWLAVWLRQFAATLRGRLANGIKSGRNE